jgi:hypothetical protein
LCQLESAKDEDLIISVRNIAYDKEIQT